MNTNNANIKRNKTPTPPQFSPHRIVARAMMERGRDIVGGNFTGSSVKGKIYDRLNEDDELQSYIASSFVQELKYLIAKAERKGPYLKSMLTNVGSTRSSNSTPPVVRKVIDKIYKDKEFKRIVVSIIDQANSYRSEVMTTLDKELRKMLETLKDKYLILLDDEIQKKIDNIKSTYFSTEEPVTVEESKNDTAASVTEPSTNNGTIAFGKNGGKILNPSTGRYVKRDGKIGRELLRRNASKKNKKESASSKNKRIKNKK